MELQALERALLATEARPLLVDARLVRRVIKRHRRLPGVGLQVPHARCYVLRRDALLEIVDRRELGPAAADLPDDVILLPRPDADELAQTPTAELLRGCWRYAFHARVHLEIERRAAAGKLTPAMLRERVHRIGQTEFDEIRLVLRQDDLLVPPHGDLETYAEFAALYLELHHFAPELLGEMFPTLDDFTATDATVAEDVDAARLLEDCRPAGTAPAARPAPAPEAPPPEEEAPFAPQPGDVAPATLRGEADDARSRGNAVRSALSRLQLAAAGGPDAGALTAEARADLGTLANRLDVALRGPGGEGGVDVAAWTAALFALAQRAVARGLFRRVEARMLYDLQSACLAAEKAIGKVDLVDWFLSFGRRPVARLLPATRPIRVARALADAAKKLPRVHLAEAERARLGELLVAARERADEVIRGALRPTIVAALREVGLRAESVPGQVASAKLVEELLDQATAHGFLGLGLLRDALSRNQLKLEDLRGPGELLGGDALLGADRRLALALDGVHRRGEIYLRGLQKVTSLLFGTRPGRVLTLYLLLPVGAAYVLMMGVGLIVHEVVEHVVNPIVHGLGREELHHLHLAKPEDRPDVFLAIVLLIFGLVHSARVRDAARFAGRAVAMGLAAVFVHAPLWVLSLQVVRGILESRAYLALRRYLLKPAVLAAAIVHLTPIHTRPSATALPAAVAIFVVVNVVLNSRTGALVEEIAFDFLARTFRRIRRHVLPGLLRFVLDFFRRITDAIDRAIYAVDEWLRFREGQSRAALAGKAAAGLVWFAIAYFLRFYVNLFLEPTFNPVKHFPVVTVAAKLMLGVTKNVTELVFGFFMPRVGGVLAGALAGLAVVSMPGVFGFLVWELKENYKLYRATRAGALHPVAIGHHGETMGALMKPGFHSGTLPKLWAKLRRAARKGEGAVEKHKEAMREVEEAVERFVARELVAILGESPAWKGGPVHVARVVLASNRIRVELGRGAHGASAAHSHGAHPHRAAPDEAERCAIAFEEQSGWLVASVARAGWLDALDGGDRILFENALGGLYQLAGVDLVREQIAAALAGAPPYDVSDEGLVVWPGGRYGTEIVYDLDAGKRLSPTVRGEAYAGAAPELARSQLLFREQPITWTEWVAAWSAEAPKRVVKGASLLPSR
jgi:hypothetical protein